jgi:predicted RNA-binding protein with PUA-like domain
MQYWLLKTEPEEYSWDMQVKKRIGGWDGVRNTRAAAYLKRMEVGDLCFFYHTGKEKQIVGVVRVHKPAYPDKSDETGKFVMVDVETVEPFKTPVTLKQIKADPRFADMQLVRIARLSVQKVEPDQWKAIRQLGGLKP